MAQPVVLRTFMARAGARTVLAAALGLALVSGCSSKRDSDKTNAGQEPASSAAPGSTATSSPASVDETTPITAEEYERLFLGLATCAIAGEHIDPKCPAKVAFQDARKRTRSIPEITKLFARLGRDNIGHASPAVRIQAAAFLTAAFGTEPSSQTLMLDAARKETEPAVLISMIQSLGAKGGQLPEVGALLLAMADHENPAVRKKAVIWLGSSWNVGLEGSLDKLIDKVRKDPDPEVRRFACKYSGDRGDDRMVPIYAEFTKDPEADPRLYAACMEGLMNSWMSYPRFHTRSQKAYELTLQRLRQTPRSQEVPPWTLMDNFVELGNPDNKKAAEWREATRPWFQSDKLLGVLEGIVTDPKAYRLARTGALQSMVALGAPEAKLAALRSGFAESHDVDAQDLVKTIDRSLGAAPEDPAASQSTPPGSPVQ